jgi:serine/threonine protein kinase
LDEKLNSGDTPWRDTPRRDTPRRDTPRRDTPVLDREDESSFADNVAAEIVVGQIVGQRFKVLSFLGKGGMGSVYLVEEILSHKRYALKTISAKATSERELKRFQLEAKATSLLSHPNLIQFQDFGLINGVQPYFVMDYCDGRTLAGLIKREGPLSVEKALPIFITICNALAYAHSQGVVHRDLKPSNIMLTSKEIKVLDFGIAKVLRDETAFNTLTQTGEIFGSPYYMSPEQCMGSQIDHRSDIYSLGCVFFETLTGAPPFMSDNPLTTMLKQQSVDPPTLKEATLGREFPPDLEKIIALMLAKNPDIRYQDLLRVADDLRSVQKGERLGSTQPKRMPKSLPKEYVAVAIGAIVLTVAVLTYSAQRAKIVPPDSGAGLNPKLSVFLSKESLETASSTSDSSDSRFYSDLIPGKKLIRQFHFPAKQIGQFGYSGTDVSANQGKFDLAQGLKNNVRIPFTFLPSLPMEPGIISKFRDDEVSRLTLHSFLVDDKTLEEIKNWRELQSLDVDKGDITDESIASLQTLPKLIDLSVEHTRLSPSGLRKLQLRRFYRLNLSYVRYAKELLPTLRQSKALQRLVMEGTELTDGDMKSLSEFPALIDLDIKDNPISDKGLTYLLNAKHLQCLSINSKNITPKSIDTFKKKTGLKYLAITTFGWTADQQESFRRILKLNGIRLL